MITNTPSESNNSLSRLFSRGLVINWEVVILVVILLAATFTRFHDLGARAMSHDESLHTRFSYNLSEDGNFQHTPLMHGPILFHATALSYTLFGDNDFTSRIYTSILGILLVMSPILFRRWLGKWGTILACLMLLISPVTMYYGRYIRHDMPSILSALLMIWAMLMYIGGGENQERRPHWLYIIAVAMIWNLGSKETAFIYIAIVGIFLVLFWLARLWQYYEGRETGNNAGWQTGMLGVFVGGVMSMGMYILLDIIKFDMFSGNPETSFASLNVADQNLFITWTFIILLGVIGSVLVTMLWAFRDRLSRIPWQRFFGVVVVALVVCMVLVFIEEISHVDVPAVDTAAVLDPADPNAATAEGTTETLSWAPMILVWGATLAGFAFLAFNRRKPSEGDDKDKHGQGFWGTMDLFPEFDLIIVIGTLILPWATAFVPYLMGGTPADYASIGGLMPQPVTDSLIRLVPYVTGPQQVGEVMLGLMAFIPLVALSWTLGLMWNWKRWLITSAIFHVLFAFFFTTIFTNMFGLVTGMYYSLGYWLEQQGVRRGSQPQYYYLLIIMPFYEFLPVIGGGLSMFVGMVMFWRTRKHEEDAIREINRREEIHAEIESATEDVESEDVESEEQVDIITRIEAEADEANSEEMLKLFKGRRFAKLLDTSLVFWGLVTFSVLLLLLYVFTDFKFYFLRLLSIEPNSNSFLFILELLPAFIVSLPPFIYAVYLRSIASQDVEQALAEGMPLDDFAPPIHENDVDENTSLDMLYAIRDSASRLVGAPFLSFFVWLAVLNLVGYSLAGEKMPWLATHLTMPLIFMTAWFFGNIVKRMTWEDFKSQGWIVAIVTLFFFAGVFQTIRPLVAGVRPFAGLTQPELNATYSWIAAVIVSGGALAALIYFMERVGWKYIVQILTIGFFSILSVLTFRSALLASFTNADYATEFLVYAHAAPGVNWVLDDIEEISLATTDGYDVALIYDNEVSWPYSWYFRDYPNARYVGDNPTRRDVDDAVIVLVGAANRSKVEPLVDDRFVRFDHIRLWWPMQNYFDLNPNRLANLFDFTNPTSAQTRQGIFEIWWNRDYSTYGIATGGDFTVTNWPVSDRMHLYVRRDVAAQIWSFGVGEGGVLNPLETGEVNQCSANWLPLQASSILESPMGMLNPTGIDIAPNGTIYVAEQGLFDPVAFGGHTVSVFNADGTFNGNIGQRGSLLSDETGIFLERPNSVEVLPDGDLLVVDTWNFRLQYLDGETLAPEVIWGARGEYGEAAQVEPTDGVWGPRDVEVDAQGRIYISDTGNKRIRVYRIENNMPVHLYDIGSAGSAPGELDEPSGVAVHPNGNIYVADTWNRRISVFTGEGVFLDTFNVRGWYDDLGNRPYLSIDTDRELLYVTDPDAGRVLVYTTAGECVGSFGEAAGEVASGSQIGVAAGIAVGSEGQVYVVDNQFGRVLVFPPFPYTPAQTDAVPQGEGEVIADESNVIQPETTAEVIEPEASAEVTAEVQSSDE